MRIIAGEARGRRILTPEGEGTRPPLDRQREAIFAILGDLVEDARVLDLFAGSGAFGLEALSRGASEAVFVERDRTALRTLGQNVVELGFVGRAWLIAGDALGCPPGGRAERAALRHRESGRRIPGDRDREGIRPLSESSRGFGLIFVDPPFPLIKDGADRADVMERVETLRSSFLEPGGVLVLRHPSSVALDLPGSRARAFGESSVVFLDAP